MFFPYFCSQKNTIYANVRQVMDYQQHPDCHKQADYGISQDEIAMRRKSQIPASMKFLLAMAICLLSACSRPVVVRQLMNEVEQRNKLFVSLASDTALIPVVENLDSWSIFYPDSMLMRAHYLLGSVYRDRGQAPEALMQFQ